MKRTLAPFAACVASLLCAPFQARALNSAMWVDSSPSNITFSRTDNSHVGIKVMLSNPVGGLAKGYMELPTRELISLGESSIAGGELSFTWGSQEITGAEIFHLILPDNANKIHVSGRLNEYVRVLSKEINLPVAHDQSQVTYEDIPQAISLTATSAYEGPLTYLVVTPPVHGSLDGVAPLLTYTPDPNYRGTDSFTFKAKDGAFTSNTARVSITILPVNDAPVAVADEYRMFEDGRLSMPAPGLLSNDTDVEGDALVANVVRGPTHGTITVSADGSFVYSPQPDFNGTDSFEYKAGDGAKESDAVTVTISVAPVNDAPEFTLPTSHMALKGPGARLTVGSATAISPGPPDESSQILTFRVSNDNPALFSSPPAIDPSGTLTVAATGIHGTATLTVSLSDDGGSADGGVDTCEPQTLTITVEPQPFQWVNLGPPGVAVNSVAVDPRDSNTIYAGTNGGVFKSTDGGTSWSAVFNAGSFDYLLRMDAQTPPTLYVSYIVPYGHGGVVKSTDGGATWQDIGAGLPETQINALAIDPVNKNVLYAPLWGTSGHLESGLYRSSDGGSTWHPTGLPPFQVGCVAADPRESDVVYVGTNGLGVHLSRDGGRTWTQTGLDYAAVNGNGTYHLAIDPDDSRLLFATAAYMGTYRSRDGGHAWDLVFDWAGPAARNPHIPGLLYIASTGDIYSSTNGGDGWAELSSPIGHPINNFGFDPSDQRVIYAATSGGVFRGESGAGANHAPGMGPIADMTIDEDAGTQVVGMTGITSGAGERQPLMVSAVSSNTGLIPNPTVNYSSHSESGELIFAPAPNASGTATITVTLDDRQSANSTASKSFVVTVNPVNDAPSAIPESYTTHQGTALRVAAPGVLSNDSDVEMDALTATLVDSPSHGSLELNADGSFVYTPDVGYFGPDRFTYRASDTQAGGADATVEITVNPNTEPVTAESSVTTREDTDAVFSTSDYPFVDADAGNNLQSVQVVSLPATGVLYLDADGDDAVDAGEVSAAGDEIQAAALAAGRFKYKPEADDHGSPCATFTFKVGDGIAFSSSAAVMNVNVTAVNDAPVLAPIGPMRVAEGSVLELNLSASDVENDSVRFALSGTPEGGMMDPNTGQFIWEPAFDQAGDHHVRFYVLDEHSPVALPLQADRWSGAGWSADGSQSPWSPQVDGEGEAIFRATGVEEGQFLTLAEVSHGEMVTFEVEPALSSGSAVFYLGDGWVGRGAARAVGLKFTGEGRVCLTGEDGATCLEDIGSFASNGWIEVSLGVEESGLFHARVGGVYSSRSGALVTGRLRFGAAVQGSAGGFRLRSVRMSQGLSDSEDVVIHVTDRNRDPIAVDDVAVTEEEVPVTIPVLANDGDPDGDTIRILSASDGVHGTAQVSDDGRSVVYTPEANFFGEDRFAYTVGDGLEGSASAAVIVTVAGTNDPPTLDSIAAVEIDEDAGAQTVSLGGITAGPGENQMLTVSAFSANTALIPHPSVAYTSPSRTGSLTFTPVADASGQTVVTVTVADGEAATSREFMVTVRPVNDPPIARDDVVTTDEDTPIDIDVLANDTDPEGGQLMVVAPSIVCPMGTGAPCLLAYTPPKDFCGTNQLTYIVTDGQLEATATVTVTVTCVPDAPADVFLTGSTIPEGSAVGTVVGTLGTEDADTGDTFTYTITGGDLSAFSISGNELKSAAVFDYEAKSTYAVRVRSTDQTDRWTEKAFIVDVTDVSEAPLAEAGGPYFAMAGRGLTLDGTPSREPDAALGDAIDSWEWDMNGDGVYGDAIGPVVRLSWDQLRTKVCGGSCLAGRSYRVYLKVKDRGGLHGVDMATVAFPSRHFLDTYAHGSASGDRHWQEAAGQWGVAIGRFTSMRGLHSVALLQSVSGLTGTLANRLAFRTRLTSMATAGPNAGLVFGWRDRANYRYVKMVQGAAFTGLMVGQVGDPLRRGERSGVLAWMGVPFRLATWYPLEVLLSPEGRVEVFRGGATVPLLSYRFPSGWLGRIGFVADRAESHFDDFTVWRYPSVRLGAPKR